MAAASTYYFVRCRVLFLVVVSICSCSVGASPTCFERGVSWSETLAVANIRDRHPISLPPGSHEPPDRARAQVCLTIGAAGEVTAVRGACGDAVLLAAVMRSVALWRFEPPEPDPTWGSSVTTSLTFQWRDHSASLIWDRHDYPIGEKDATKLVRAVPHVVSLLKQSPKLILEVDVYPEERDGVFYLFHLYESGEGMDFTLGWYEVNAYSGEVWDGLEFQPIRAGAVRRMRRLIRRRLGLSNSTRYEGLDPSAGDVETMMRDACADRPRPPH